MPHAFDVQDYVRQYPMMYPAVAAGTIVSEAVDLRGMRGLAISFLTGLWATGSLTLTLQEAQAKDDGTPPGTGDYVPISGAVLTVDRSDGINQLIRIGIRSESVKSHVRLVLTSPTGNPGVSASGVAIDPYGDPDADTWDLVV